MHVAWLRRASAHAQPQSQASLFIAECIVHPNREEDTLFTYIYMVTGALGTLGLRHILVHR